MHSKLAIVVVCLTLLTSVVNAVEAGQKHTGHESIVATVESSPGTVKFFLDVTKQDFNDLKGALQKYPSTTKFELILPGYLDYGFLIYDISIPVRAYLDGEITGKGLCKQLFGVGGGFGGSVAGTSLGTYVGTLVYPGVGTAIGGFVGGLSGYYTGKEIGRRYVGHNICNSVI